MSRHRTTIVLIALAGLCAALLMITTRVALSEQFLSWVRAQPWYTPRRAWVALTSLATFGAVIPILQYWLAHYPKQTSMSLVVGLCDPDRYVNPPKGTKSAKESSLLHLLGAPEGSVTVVHCMFRLTNTCGRAIKGVRLQLEYPESYLVDDKVVVRFENVALVMQKPAEASHIEDVKRQVLVVEGAVRASYNLELLRYGETVVIPEPLKIRRVTAAELEYTSAFRPGALTARLTRNAAFLDYLRLRAFVFSEESKLETAFDIFSFSGSSPDDLSLATHAIEEAMWNGRAPRPGELYLCTPGRRPRTSRLETSVPSRLRKKG